MSLWPWSLGQRQAKAEAAGDSVANSVRDAASRFKQSVAANTEATERLIDATIEAVKGPPPRKVPNGHS